MDKQRPRPSTTNQEVVEELPEKLPKSSDNLDNHQNEDKPDSGQSRTTLQQHYQEQHYQEHTNSQKIIIKKFLMYSHHHQVALTARISLTLSLSLSLSLSLHLPLSSIAPGCPPNYI